MNLSKLIKNKIKNAMIEEINFQDEQGFNIPLHFAGTHFKIFKLIIAN
ncbi:hypothetical protein [Spiroplasma endosymbiont of Calodromius spilotus]